MVINKMFSRLKSIARRPLFSGESSSNRPHFIFDDSCQIPNLSMIFERYIGVTPGTFVEVGAYDGITFSNTYGLIKNDWIGYYIEPDPSIFKDCKINLQKFNKANFLNYAIASQSGTAELYRQGPLSTLSKAHHKDYSTLKWTKGEPAKGSLEVECKELNDMLTENHIVPEFELLVIDVEGFEHEIFKTFELEYWKPQMLIIELADVHPDFPQFEKINLELKIKIERAGYSIVYKDHINSIFVSDKVISNRLALL